MQFSQKYYFLALALLLAIVSASTYQFYTLYHYQKQLTEAAENRHYSYQLTNTLRRSSDELTRLARAYVVTGNPRFEEQFWQVLAIRNGEAPLPKHYDRVYWDFLATSDGKAPFKPNQSLSLHEMMSRAHFTEEELILLKRSQKQSDELVKLESIAFNAMKGQFQDDQGGFSQYGKPNQALAIETLHGDEYHQAKISIMSPINDFYQKLDLRTTTNIDRSNHHLSQSLIQQISLFIISILLILSLMFASWRYHLYLVKKLHQQVLERTEELSKANSELVKAFDEIKILKGIIPICSYCYNIRDDKGTWDRIEDYISKHSMASFTHGICPDCTEKVRHEFIKEPE